MLIVSEDAGLGKTTILLKLIDEMKDEYGDAFRFAFVDQPALSPAQMIAQITGSITKAEPHEDKLKNLKMLRDALLEANEHGGKSIIVVDEAQMLCEAHDVLQELRTLINLTHNGQYLHTFILSGSGPFGIRSKECRSSGRDCLFVTTLSPFVLKKQKR